MKRSDKSEIIFKIIAYTFVTVFAIFCLYPFLFTISAAISGKDAVQGGKIILLPKDVQFEAFKFVFKDKDFWISYSNTLFYTFYGTIWGMFISVTGAYALSKRRLLFRRQLNFLVVFTMWFSAGMIPTMINYQRFGINSRWGIIFSMGVLAFNIILLRNAFEAVPQELEEAAILDGANEFKILTTVYLPMSKAVMATVTLFYALGRWNGYFWTRELIKDSTQLPLQVFLRNIFDNMYNDNGLSSQIPNTFAADSVVYALLICSIIPIIIIYPYLQQYFAKGMNVGGVKE